MAELRAPLGVDSIAGGNTARYCESGGILLYTVDSTLRNGLGVYKVLDAMPGSTAWGCSDETSISTMGRGQGRGPSHFEVPELGVTFDLTDISADGTRATLKVTRQDTKITAAPAVRRRAVHDDADRLPAQRARRRDLRVGLRRRDDRHRRCVQHTFANPGRYTVKLTVNGATTTQTVDVSAPFTGTLQLSGPDTAVAGGTASFTTNAPDATFEVRRANTVVERKAHATRRRSPAPTRSRPASTAARPASPARSSGRRRPAGTSCGTRPRSRAGPTAARARSPATR